MTPRIGLATFLLVAALAPGCNSVKGAQTPHDSGYARRAEFVDRSRKELAVAEAELDRLAARIERSTGPAKASARTALEAARRKWVEAKNRLEKAETASESTWDYVKDGFRQASTDLDESVRSMRQWLSDKIEP